MKPSLTLALGSLLFMTSPCYSAFFCEEKTPPPCIEVREKDSAKHYFLKESEGSSIDITPKFHLFQRIYEKTKDLGSDASIAIWIDGKAGVIERDSFKGRTLLVDFEENGKRSYDLVKDSIEIEFIQPNRSSTPDLTSLHLAKMAAGLNSSVKATSHSEPCSNPAPTLDLVSESWNELEKNTKALKEKGVWAPNADYQKTFIDPEKTFFGIPLKKNRYENILAPYSTRVEISLLPDEKSNYINANHVDVTQELDEESKKKAPYIATQAPLDHTKEDFWRMVYEKNSPMIVNLTSPDDEKSNKTSLYWPSKPDIEVSSEMTVKRLSEHPDGKFVIRTFEIARRGHGSKQVTMIHYTGWPDQGVLERTDLEKLAMHVKNSEKDTSDKGPTVVHCSAGVGRTGTVITYLQVKKQLSEKSKEHLTQGELNDFILRGRKERGSSFVQTKAQYELLYKELVQMKGEGLSPTKKARKD